MATNRRDRPPARPASRSVGGPSNGYLALSKRPLHVLLFLLPLIAFYEIGAGYFLTEAVSGQVETIRAYRIVSDVFRFLGAVGSHHSFARWCHQCVEEGGEHFRRNACSFEERMQLIRRAQRAPTRQAA